MAENFYTLLTATGKAKIANSAALGTTINFKTLRVGDGNGNYYEPTENQENLVHQVWTGNIGSITTDETNTNWIITETIIPASDGGFFIREAGIFDEDGDLIAIAKLAETYKPVVTEGSTKDLSIKIILEVSNSSSITLKIDPAVTLATKKDIQTLSSSIATNTTEIQNARKGKANLKEKIDDIDTQLSESANILIPTTGSAANAILLNIPTLSNNKKYSFKASATSNGNVTINGKAFKKSDGTQISSSGIKVNKIYDFYYDSASDSVFILAKAEGDATVDNVLATKGFSNGDDTGLVGTMPNNGAVSSTLTNNNQEYTIPAGFHNGLGKIKAIITNLAAAVIKAGTTVGGIVGTFTADATALATDIISGKSAYVNGTKITGTATVESLGGLTKVASGTYTNSVSIASNGTMELTMPSSVINNAKYVVGTYTVSYYYPGTGITVVTITNRGFSACINPVDSLYATHRYSEYGGYANVASLDISVTGSNKSSDARTVTYTVTYNAYS